MVAAAQASAAASATGGGGDAGAASDSTPPLQNDSASAAGAGAASASADDTLKIPITSSAGSPDPDLFIEIFPEELPDVPPSVLARVLRDEDAPLRTWTDAALLYVQRKRELECSDLLTEACELEKARGFQTPERVRTLASAGIAALTMLNAGSSVVDPPTPENVAEGGGGGDNVNPAQAERNEELKGLAEDRFMRAGKVDQLFPMTWVGRGMLNLSIGRVDQARFFFETTLRQCGQVLPALLGMAAVRYRESDFRGAQEMYGRAMTLFPEKSGGSARVGFGLACYKLGQIDRAKAAFKRALDMDRDNVEAMIGLAVLDMASLDETARDFRQRSERCIRLISSANLVDRSNAAVQNHLANHYFWKWAPVPGTVEVTGGSAVVKGSRAMNLEAGDPVRIGQGFETVVAEEEGEEAGFRIRDAWKGASQSGLKLWKKDYDRVVTLARGAYSSTTVKEIQAESLFLLARVYHVRDEMENATKFYDRACKLAPDLGPARFGLAQCLIWDEKHEEAAAHLRLVLGSSPHSTDALAALGLVEVKLGKDRREAFGYLKKAIDQDPLNAELVQLEALALQRREADYDRGLERYRQAARLVEGRGRPVPYEVWSNMGVLCHETGRHDDALAHYGKALQAIDGTVEGGPQKPSLDDAGSGRGENIRHKDNDLFWEWVDAGVKVTKPSEGGGGKVVAVVGAADDDGGGAASLPDGIKVGDHVRLGDDFVSEITEIRPDGGKDRGEIVLKRAFVPPDEEMEGPKEGDDGNDEEKEKEKEKPPRTFSLSVKRSNHRLDNAPAVSVAFNLARLHEAAGRIVPAVELHKAIVSRHPSYVNSYLRLACIARDCGSLPDCSEWLKAAVAVAPGNPEVLTLVGNLHLSLCDWAPAQTVFGQLLEQKVSDVEAYSMLSLGNIYFNNLKTPRKYTKHLQYSADYYKRILTKDRANAYAANGLGTVLAERGELLRAKEAFNRVREVSGDAIPDALLNLGHIYLAQKRHPEALQMYRSYMNRTRGSAANITSKSRDDDDAEVLLYVAFAYFDWARITEQLGNAKAAPADERYRKCVEFIEQAMEKSTKENVVLRYDWCMGKLHAANCVMRRPMRGIRRTAQDVRDALDGLEKALPVVQTLLQWKNEGKRIPVATSMLNNFLDQCRGNMDVARTHLSEELKRESEAREMRELQRIEAEAQQKEEKLRMDMERQARQEEEEERDKKARAKMDKVSNLVAGWEQEAEAAKRAAESKKARKESKGPLAPEIVEGEDEDAGIFDNDLPAEPSANANANALFDDSDDDDDEGGGGGGGGAAAGAGRGAPKDKDEDAGADEEGEGEGEEKPPVETEKDLFGDSSDEESDEELVPEASSSSKRGAPEESGGDEGGGPAGKKRRVLDDDED